MLSLRCSFLNSRYSRLSGTLLKHSKILTKDHLGNLIAKNFSLGGSSLNSINKRLLEARNKLPKYPETESCSQSERVTSHNRDYTTGDQQKPIRPVRQTNDPCLPRHPTNKPCKRITDPCQPLTKNTGFKGGNGDGGGNKWNKWLITTIAVAGCGGIVYLWMMKPSSESETGYKHILPGSLAKPHNKVPHSASDIPKNIPYLLIGGGTASFSAFRAIKSLDPKAKVLVISNEYHKPYMRPPLSKELWFHGELNTIPENFKFKQWNGAVRSLYYEPEEFYIDPTQLLDNPNGGVAVCQGYEVKKINFCNNEVILTDGTVISYDKCLIATGCEPKGLDVFQSAPRNVRDRVSLYRTPEDFEYLKKLTEEKKSVVIIGSGFLGSELSCALAKYVSKISKPVKIYQVFHESGNIAQALPEYLSTWTTRKIQEQGVCVIPQASVLNASMMHNHLKLDLSNGQSILTDHVVICVGNEPNTQIANTSGLEIDKKLGGFVVNSEMEAKKHLYVAGDVASFEDPLLGRRRIESHDHAVVSGRLAGENMAGKKKSYTHQAMFWSDLGPNIGFEGIGIVDSSLPTVGVFAKLTPEELEKIRQISFKDDGSPIEEMIEGSSGSNIKSSTSINTNQNNKNEKNKITIADENNAIKSDNNENDFEKGVIFYLRDEKIVGILLWNLFNRINIARKVVNENKKFDDLNEVAKLFEIHS